MRAGTMYIVVVGVVVAVVSTLTPQTDTDSDGAALYERWCASCHGSRGEGRSAPPLFLFKDYPESFLRETILRGVPGTPMKPISLAPAELEALIAHIKTLPAPQTTETGKVQVSRVDVIMPTSLQNLTAVVMRGNSSILLLEDEKPLGTLYLTGYVHGGLKWWHSRLFIPEREGTIHVWFLREGRLVSRKICDYLRSIYLAEELLAICWTPVPGIYRCDRSLQQCSSMPAPCMPSQLIRTDNQIIIMCRDTSIAYTYQGNSWKVQPLEEPITDALVSPDGRYVLTSWRRSRKIIVYDLDGWQKVATIEGTMAHLSASAWWYHRGKVYVAIPLIKQNQILIVKVHDGDTPIWSVERSIPTRGTPAFARTCPHTPYIWADENGANLLLIDKTSFNYRRLTLDSSSTLFHPEFNRECSKVFISVKGQKEGIWIVDAVTLDSIAFIGGREPAGKYNWWHKQPQATAVSLGEEIYMKYCWGCHHPTKQAFGPSLQTIATLPASFIDRYIAEPHGNMPRITITKTEKLLLLKYIASLNHAEYAPGH